MLYPVKIMAFWSQQTDKTFLEWLQDSFHHLFELTLSKNFMDPQQINYIAFDNNNQLLLHSATFESSLEIPKNYIANPSFILQLSQQLTQFYQKLIAYPDNYPLKLVYFDENGQPIYDNKGFDGNFFAFSQGTEPLENWIQDEIKDNANHQVSVMIPSSSFDQILIQDYRGLYDQEGHFRGTFSQVIDLHPLLATYLEESGQALVGWSDTTSGASISNHLFDDDYHS
ncbi:hypothetical protein [Streptococcus halotolerans]|uniref:hypothetical protein n=1 Tax=Streptococcus halotolerans TaxID=1814128 RepID=UPI0012FD0FE4|nr:hypothetical protein [Streptococcus halotolerans]